MRLSDAIIQRIYQLCEERNMTINKASDTAGITQSTVSDIVNGVTKKPTVSTIKKLCDGFEISIREFFNSDLFDNLEQEIR